MSTSHEFDKLYRDICKWLAKSLHDRSVSDREWNTVEKAKEILQKLSEEKQENNGG